MQIFFKGGGGKKDFSGLFLTLLHASWHILTGMVWQNSFFFVVVVIQIAA